MSAALQTLLNEQKLWRARQHDVPVPDGIQSGWPAFDALLPGAGWPRSGLVDLMIEHDGIGELALLMPLLAKQSQHAPVVLIAPPYLPYAAHWQQQGVQLKQLHIVQCAAEQAMWASEQALRAGCCSLVLCWPQQACDKTLRRLQLAAESAQALGVIMRDVRHITNPSPAPLRISLHAGNPHAQLRVVKTRGMLPDTRALAFRSLPSSATPW